MHDQKVNYVSKAMTTRSDDNPSIIKTQMNFELLMLLGRLGHQGSSKNFCNFATFGIVFACFQRSNEFMFVLKS